MFTQCNPPPPEVEHTTGRGMTPSNSSPHRTSALLFPNPTIEWKEVGVLCGRNGPKIPPSWYGDSGGSMQNPGAYSEAARQNSPLSGFNICLSSPCPSTSLPPSPTSTITWHQRNAPRNKEGTRLVAIPFFLSPPAWVFSFPLHIAEYNKKRQGGLGIGTFLQHPLFFFGCFCFARFFL